MSIATIVGIAAYVAFGLTAQLVTPSYSALSMGASALAIGRQGWLMQLAFVARGLAALTLVAALVALVPGPARSEWGLVLIAVWGISTFMLALFATDMPGGSRTAHGAVHAFVAVVAYVAVAAGELLVSLDLGHDPDWRSRTSRHHSPSPCWSPSSCSSPVFALPCAAWTGGWARYSGLLQRVFLALALLWMLIVAVGLL